MNTEKMNTERKRLDMFSNIVDIGDTIAFPTPNYSGMSVGTILKFTPKGMSVSRGKNGHSKYQLFGNGFIKVPDSYLFMEM